MEPLRMPAEPPTELPPLVYYILPPAQDEEAAIGPGDLEIEFEAESEPDAE